MKVKIPENEYQLMDMLADYVLGYDTNDVITIRSADLLSALRQAARSQKTKKWIKHDGTSDCPIAPDTIVQAKTAMVSTGDQVAGYLPWELIDKYRVVKQPENKE